MAENPVLPRRRRRFLRFSLRSLLLFTTLIAAALGWTVHKARQQGVAIAALQKAGFYVEQAKRAGPPTFFERLRSWLGDEHPDNVTSANALVNPVVTDEQIAPLQCLASIQVVDISKTRITDAGLAHLQGLPNLGFLYLGGTRLTGAGLVYLHRLPALHSLHLNGTQVTDAELARLHGITGLKLLDLNDTQVTDAGLAHLQGLSKLAWLELNGTQVSDAGLALLQGVTTLEWLEVCETQVSEAGIASLKIALPRLQIPPQRTTLKAAGN